MATARNTPGTGIFSVLIKTEYIGFMISPPCNDCGVIFSCVRKVIAVFLVPLQGCDLFSDAAPGEVLGVQQDKS